MTRLTLLLSSLALLCHTHTSAEPTTKTNATPEQLPAFSAAESLKSNFSCYGGPFTSFDGWLKLRANHPKFDADKFGKQYSKVDFERRQQQIDCRIFVYESDGHLVEGVMLQPKTAASGSDKLPVVIYNRGGNAKGGKWYFDAIQQFLMPLAEQGYVVITSQYRGAAGFPSGVKAQLLLDQFGGNDVNDIKNLLPIINGMPAADPTRIAMKGFSRGGMMSYLAAQNMPQLKALIVEAGVADLEAHLVMRKDMENLYTKAIPNYSTEKSAQLKARSVLHWLDKLPANLPILLLHGDKDERVEVAQSENLAKALAEKGRPHKLVIFPGANHELDPHRADADAETAAWLKTYL
jgi:dipeptidyl aminopeptidase/acylaminoacyl peptidase